MVLVCQFVLLTLNYNIWFKLEHIPGQLNCLGDYLSHFQWDQARHHQPTLNITATEVPPHLQLSTLLTTDCSKHL